MIRSVRFSILDLVTITFVAAMFAANFVPREIILLDPIAGHRFWQLGFPIVWTKYVTPSDEPILRLAIQNLPLLLGNALLCVAIGIVMRRIPPLIVRSTAPESNPAKILLYFFGFLLVLLALSTPAAALGGSTDARGVWIPERPGPTLAASIGGALAILLAHGEFNRLNRSLTIGWGITATATTLYLSYLTSAGPVPSLHTRGQFVTLFFVALLANVGWLGWQKPAYLGQGSNQRRSKQVQLS